MKVLIIEKGQSEGFPTMGHILLYQNQYSVTEIKFQIDTYRVASNYSANCTYIQVLVHVCIDLHWYMITHTNT